MEPILRSRRHHYMARVGIFLITVALVAGMVGCGPAQEYTLSVSCTPGGTVTYPGKGTFTYPAGAIVLLEAEPEESYSFVNWSGNVSAIADVNTATTTITMNGHYFITANFVQGQLIRNWYDLGAISNNLSGSYILMNDLGSNTAGYEELASETANQGKGWEPIGTWGVSGWQGGPDFSGTFDGQGYEIRDLFINRPWEAPVALFGDVDSGGVIKNLGVMNVNVTGGNLTGGLVAFNSGTVSDCYSSGKRTGYAFVGGLVGYNYYGTVSNCYSSGNVTTSLAWVGGLVGENSGSVSNSYSTCSVSGNGDIGGLVGSNSGTVSNSYSTGSVTCSSGEYTDFGGFVGFNYKGKIMNCYSTGSVHYEGTTDPTDKGFAGKIDTGGDYEMTGNFWDTETSGQTSTAGNATGKTTTEMQDISTFSGAGWDIIAVANPSVRNPSYIWNIVDDETYLFLSWQSIS